MAKVLFRSEAEIPAHLKSSAQKVGEGDAAMWEVDTDIEDVGGMRSALAKLKAEKADFKKIQKTFEGIDPELAKKLIAEAEKNATPEEMQLRHAKAIEALKAEHATELATLRGEIDRSLIDAEAARLLATSGANVDLLGPHLAGRLGVHTSDDGARSVIVLDAQGNPAMDKNETPLTTDSLIKEFRDHPSFGLAFKVDDKGGARIPGGKGGTGNSAAGSTYEERAKVWNDVEATKKMAAGDLSFAR